MQQLYRPIAQPRPQPSLWLQQALLPSSLGMASEQPLDLLPLAQARSQLERFTPSEATPFISTGFAPNLDALVRHYSEP